MGFYQDQVYVYIYIFKISTGFGAPLQRCKVDIVQVEN